MPCDSDWKGPTTFWSEEAQFLREYLERPQDCYVVHVTEAFRFTLPLSRDHMLTVANPNAKLKWAADGGIAHCTDLNAQALSLHSGSLAGDRLVPACCNVEEACRRWDLPLHELANLRTNVQPEPIAQLVLEGRWGDLVWRASWKSPFATPPAHLDLPALRRRNQCQPADPRSGAACGYAEVHALLRDLQRWSPTILQATEMVHVEAEADRVQRHCATLSQLDRLLGPPQKTGPPTDASLVSAHLLATQLCNMSHVASASQHGADLLFGGSFAEAAAWRAKEMAGKEYLRQRLLCFDMANVLAERQDGRQQQ